MESKKLRVLVIGGSYFAGKRFVNMTKERYDLTVFNRGTRPLNCAEVKEIYGDRRISGQLSKIATETDNKGFFDVVVDFCAYIPGDIKAVAEILNGRIGEYIFLSTCDVYEHGTGRLQNESAAFEKREISGEAGEYIAGKVTLEKEAEEVSKKYGIPFTTIRPSVIYGPDNYAPREGMYFTWINKAGQILHPTDSDGEFQLVYVDDVVRAIVGAIEKPSADNRAYNLAPEPPETYESFAKALETFTSFEIVPVTVEFIKDNEIGLPYALTRAESNYYDGTKVLELITNYTELSEGLRKSYNAFLETSDGNSKESRADFSQTARDIEASDAGFSSTLPDMEENGRYEDCISTIERLFEENRPKEAEMFMLEMLGRARMTEDSLLELQMLNELIGYYRQTGERERLEAVIERSLDVAGLPELMNRDGGRLSFATTLLNAANGYRSIGELDKSRTLYVEVEEIYKEILPREDMLYAGLHNNISLLYQEKKQYDRAKEHLLKALNIVTVNNAGFETAVTYANLANTSIIEATELAMSNDETEAAKVFMEAEEYAAEAIKRFEARNTIDAHYCAALSALGMCKYNDGHYFEARDLFLKAMEIVERTIGRNGQYDRLKENFEICDKKCMNGQKLSKLYFEQVGLPMLKEKFPDYISKMAVGLVGKGSDCFGFDDFTSMDHDWGPDFCIWVSDETYEKIGDELTKAYEALPGEFMGYKRTTTAHGKGRRGVFTVSGFYKDLLGVSSYSGIDWRNVPDYSLAAAVNGEIYFDNEGTFSKIRSELMKGYPEDIKYLKIAEMMAKSSQAGQYNYPRMLKRGDRLTADIMLTDSIKYLLVLAHYTEGKYPPHDKWLYRSFCKLNCAVELKPIIDSLHASFSMNAKEALDYVNQMWDKAGDLIAAKLYAEDLISDVTNYLDYHSDELVKKAEYSKLNDEELVRLIAKTEFAAFDKVKNEGGRASCQNDWPTFSVMRKSQYKTWDRTMLIQYLYDFNREMSYGHNLITEKYGRMMESTAPDKYSELKHHFPALSEDKKKIIEQIVEVQMSMLEDFALKHPLLADNARSFYTDDDNFNNTSYETYLRGEISTYSDKMLQLYGRYVVRCLQEEKNIAEMIILNTARFYGFDSLEAFENAGKSK